jgi:hypothetical protein
MNRSAYLNPFIALQGQRSLSTLSAPGGDIEGIYAIAI